MAGPKYTPREVEIILLLAAGLTQQEIARYLLRSPETVKTHMTKIRERAGGLTNEAIVADAICFGIILGGQIEETRLRVLT